MIGLSGIGFRRKPRPFNYKPRHFDPDKEAREARYKSVLGKDYEEGQYVPGMYIRTGRMSRIQSSVEIKRSTKATVMRISIFIILLLVTLYFISDVIERFAVMMTR